MLIIPVILSGGAGTRLWPLSCGDHPKQFLKLVGEHTMIQDTLLRLEGLEIGTPIISCGESHRFLVAQQICEILPRIQKEKLCNPTIILEPIPKNTAPAIAVACCSAIKQDENAVVIVLPSDHVIKNVEVFQNSIQIAIDYAIQGKLVTFGIVPTYPATGYGYIKDGEHLSHHVYTLEQFVEKPCIDKAREYLNSGDYSWNSGMFVFKASVFLKELELYNSDMAKLSIKSFEEAQYETDFIRLNKDFYSQIVSNSIDYSVMEKTKNGIVVKLNAGWDDVGSWSALYDINKKDSNMNVVQGNVITVDTTCSYINAGTRTVATIGLDNVIIVDSKDALLVAAKGKAQDVKKIVEQLHREN